MQQETLLSRKALLEVNNQGVVFMLTPLLRI